MAPHSIISAKREKAAALLANALRMASNGVSAGYGAAAVQIIDLTVDAAKEELRAAEQE